MNDFDLALSRVTIADILEDAGLELGRGNRIACPIHDGKNKSAFSYTQEGYCCFSCGAKGGLIDLLQALHGITRQDAVKYLYVLAGMSYTEPSSSWHCTSPPHFITRQRIDRYAGNPGYTEAKTRLDNLTQRRRNREICHRRLQADLKVGRLSLSDYYIKDQLLLYELEELDRDIAAENFIVNSLRKTGTTNEKRDHGSSCASRS